MPPFMLRSSPFWIAVILVGGMMPVARGADPPCTSQIPPVSPPAPTAPAGTTPAPKTNPADLPIEVATDEFDGDASAATLKGNVEVHQGDRSLKGNQMQYQDENGVRSIESNQHLDYEDSLVHVTGESGSYSGATGAAFKSADFTLKQRAARGAAKELKLTPDGVLDLNGVSFTTCPANDKSWDLRASDIKLDTRTKIGTGRDARVDFFGVPLIYLPWISFPLSSERKSGFLFPGIGNTSTGGFQLSVPYYFNIRPNADFTFEPIVYTKRGVDLGGDLRWLGESQHGELDWNYLPYDRTFGAERDRIRLNELAELPADVRLKINAETVSDTTYFEDFSKGPEGASTAFLERMLAFTYRGEHWRMDAQAQQWQTIDTQNVTPDQQPYARAPWFVVGADYSLGSRVMLRYGFDSELVYFRRDIPGPDTNGWRADLLPRAALDVTGPGYFLRPAIAWRLTQYELDTLGTGQTTSDPSRVLPIASLDGGLQFERATGSRNQRTVTLEPRLMYLYVPYRNQNDLPIFDTNLPDLNPVQLFRSNRYVGIDRVSDANQMSVALTSRLLDAADGRQFLAGTIGETYYFTIPQVTLPGEAPLNSRSNVVAQLAVNAFQNWTAGVDLEWDPQNHSAQRTQVAVQYQPAVDSVLNFIYRYQAFQLVPGVPGQPVTTANPCAQGYVPPVTTPPQPAPTCQGFDQVEVSGAWPVKQKWNIFFRDVYSLRDQTELERFLGFEYRSCCWRLRLGARRFVNTHSGGQETGVWLQLELAGLAGVGSASDAFLTEEIRGYVAPFTKNPQTPGALKSVW
jgi:LPS-assembly protein